MSDATRWLDYVPFNEAVAEELFSLDKAGRPVYLLPDQDALDAVSKRAGAAAGAEGRAALLAAVRGTLVLDEEGVQPFQQHLGKSQLHAWNPIETPPSLALLVVLSMAADAMHAGDGMAANNYYGRLMTLLDVPEWRRGRVQSAYQHVAEDIWGTVNDWLEAWEGERGTPTAYAVGQRYIGLPMSQALVRQHDRERLAEVFSAEGLPPGYQMALADMESVLEAWVNRQPPVFSNPLRILWGNATARERIAAVACLELEAWRGQENAAQPGAVPSRYASVRLMAQVRTFPRASIELNLTLAAATDADATATLARADGPLTMRLVKAGPGSLRFEDARHLDPASLLTDEVSLTVGAAVAPMTRLPRRLVPLRFDDLQNCYVEVERVQLGEQTLVIAAENLRDNIEKVLAAVARPGWSVLDAAAAGVPPGWLVFRGVQVFDRFTGNVHVDLQPLLPRSSATLVLSGGFSLPGRLRKWSSLDPPEVQVVTPQASQLTVRVDRGSKIGEALFEERVDGSVAVVPLAGRDLADGEYMVTLWVDEDKKPSATSLLRLRSGDSPIREHRDRASGLVYRPSAGPLWPLSACEPDGSPDVDGARSAVPAVISATSAPMPPAAPRPRPARAAAPRQLVRAGRALGDNSCMSTGLHRMLLPPVLPGRPVSKSIEGECTTCGLVKRYPGTAHGARKRAAKGAGGPLNLAALPRVSDDDDDGDHAVAFDALCHLGNGTAAEFGRVAGQVEGSALFADVLLRTLELLGHIDVRRHESSQAPVEFEMTPPTLVELAQGVWWLVGRAPGGLTAALREAATQSGCLLDETVDEGVPRRVLRCGPDQLEPVLASSERLAEVRVVTAAGAALAAALPSLSGVAAALPRTSVPAYDALAKWDVKAANWAPTTSLATSGAYRLGGFSPLYGVRSPEDVAAGSIAFTSPQLAKHVANLWAADPLAGYHAGSSSVVVPLGCDLPVLYGRALALCSGLAPKAYPSTRMLQYAGVPADVADVLHARLTT